MKLGRGAWVALGLVTLAAIPWTEGMLWTIRTGSKSAGILLVLFPFLFVYGGTLFSLLRLRPKRSTDRVTVHLIYRATPLFCDEGELRIEGGQLVFDGDWMGFSLGHHALLDQPRALLMNSGARLAGTPKGTRLVMTGRRPEVKAWARASAAPTRRPVPLLFRDERESSGADPGRSMLLFSVACALAGGIIGGFLDLRHVSPPGTSMAATVAIGLGGMMGLLWGATVLSERSQRIDSEALRAAGFTEAEAQLQEGDQVPS